MANTTLFSDGDAEPSPQRIREIVSGCTFSGSELVELLSARSPDTREALYTEALSATRFGVGNAIRLRGLVEFSNRCSRNCLYCGIRHGNKKPARYRLDHDEIMACAEWIAESGYGSMVLQSGENHGREDIAFIERAVREIRRRTPLCITLSVGEHPADVYRRWFDAGAERYLLRIETSSPDLYARIHPAGYSFSGRIACLDHLREIGYQVGTGVMIGLPGQTIRDLAADIAFFRRGDFDMFGMGPYIPNGDTPLATPAAAASWQTDRDNVRKAAINMIAVLRLVMPDANIAAATALDVFDRRERERALAAGANVVMPVTTPVRHRADYRLYPGKPCIDEDAVACRGCMARRIAAAGRPVAWHERGDSPHFAKRQGKGKT